MDTTVFDIQKLLESTCDDEDLAREVVRTLVQDTPEQLNGLELALAGNDAKTAERAAHSLKAVAATAGGELLRAKAYECELLGHDGDLDGIRERLPELRRLYTEFEAALRQSGFLDE
ncbi:MAG: Hpt domain-containing protein [Planctomycetaceae bacterium]|nr:Hpt domain-containing protein [Planctomycetaceae bacterium]